VTDPEECETATNEMLLVHGIGVNTPVVSPYFIASGMQGHRLDGCHRRRRLLVLSPIGKASWWVSRLARHLYERLMLPTQR
jgi:hypothetical protein